MSDATHTPDYDAVDRALYLSDDQIERQLCSKRGCGIIGKHTHGDACGTFIGQPEPRDIPSAETGGAA